MADNEKLKVSNIIQKIDTNLAAYYQKQGRNDYYEQIDDIKIGKFERYCLNNKYDSDAIETELDCNGSNDEDIENCEIIGFDDNMPIPPDTPKTDIDKHKFRVLKLIYKSSLKSNASTQSTPQNIYTCSPLYTPTQHAFNSCFTEDDILKRTCTAIGKWYIKMGNDNYYDNNGYGLFSKWFHGEGMEINDMSDEFEEFENCGYLIFHTDKETQINHFPLPIKYNNCINKEKIQFKIMSYCFQYGITPNSIDDINPFDDINPIDYNIDNEWILKTEDIYSKLCPKLYAAIVNQENNLMKLFAIGYKYNISLVQLLTDTFMRDRLKCFIQNNQHILTVSEWSFQNAYIQYLVNKYGKNIRIKVSAGIKSYIKRIVPKFRMDPVYKINDNLREIAMHFKAATEFIRTILVDGSTDYKNPSTGTYDMSNAPYQWDFCIAVRECQKTETVIKPEEFEYDEEEEIKTDLEYNNIDYFDILGDIKDKLQYNNCKFIQTEFNPNKYDDTKLMSFVRCYMDSYKHFLLKCDIKKNKFPRGKRFCTLIDRRKLITKYIKNKNQINSQEQYKKMFRNKNGNKMDDILFWIPPNNSDCNSDLNMYNNGIKEVYFEQLLQCLIPGYDYNNTKQYDDTKSKIKYKNLQQTINSSSKCNGGLLIFSFQIDADDEIACYLCWQGQWIRFLQQDILQILPKIFVSSQMNNAFVQQAKKHKNENIVNKIQYCDRKFDSWYNKIANRQKQ